MKTLIDSIHSGPTLESLSTWCRNAGSLLRLVNGVPTLTFAPCGRNDCPGCINWKLRRLLRRIPLGIPLYMLTLTLDPKTLATSTGERNLFQAGFANIARRVKRRGSGMRFHYLAVTEAHRSGHLHAHAIFHGCSLNRRWWRDTVKASGLGQRVWIDKLNNPSKSLAYVAKYVSKDHGAGMGRSRFWVSRGFAPKTKTNFPEKEKEKSEVYRFPWSVEVGILSLQGNGGDKSWQRSGTVVQEFPWGGDSLEAIAAKIMGRKRL